MKNIFSKLSKNKKIIIIAVLSVVVIFGAIRIFFPKNNTNYTIAKVEKGTVVQEVTETGTVKTGEEVSLAFKTPGRIEKTYVQIGNAVKAGQNLVKLESNQLYIQLSEAQANLSVAKARLEKLVNGASSDELKVTETSVINAQISLDAANKNLNDAYQSGLIILEDSYLKSYNALESVKIIQRLYFGSYDQQGIKVTENKNYMENSLATAKIFLDTAKNIKAQNDIDKSIIDMQRNLNIFSQSLTIIRQVCEEGTYWNSVSSADKTILDTQRSYINAALTNLLTGQQLISTKKSAVDSAQGAFNTAQSQLSLQKANPRKEDVDLYTAQVQQAQAQVDLIYQQINDNVLKAPTDGQVTDIIKKAGEIVQVAEKEISFISTSGPQVKIDVYEEDVVKIKVNDLSEISFIAFPDKIFLGKILAINPAQKIVGGVVYYEVTVAFNQKPTEEIKPGMTADVKIKTAQRDNVLFLPQDAINKNNGKSFVDIFKDDKKTERIEVVTGLEGSDDRIEIISGLKEGDSIAIK